MGGRELHQRIQLRSCRAGIDGLCRQRQGIRQVVGSAGGHQGGGRVQQDDVPARRFLSRENFTNDGGVGRGVAT